ncbi:MAG TPA: galactokinase [Clostridiales bacterium]|nr:galactokinase [Clostridiales bacterium]HBR08396.1 galactokinase [Clostridiales bacterium]
MREQYFAPGRIELAGNHTDHQKGRVLAAAADRGITAQVEPNLDGMIRIVSEGYGVIEIDIFDLEPKEAEKGSAAALVRGVAGAMDDAGARIGGFDASLVSALRPGGGLSSSAAFSVLIGKILNGLYNGGSISAAEIAGAGRVAENRYFGKPSGFMDRLVCALGKPVYIDFMTGKTAPVTCDFGAMGLVLCLLDTGGSHENLTSAYAQITEDMEFIAGHFGCGCLAEVDPSMFFEAPHLPGREREEFRAAHFFDENARVPKMRDALLRRDAVEYLRLMNESGRSSETQLQNIRTAGGSDALEKGLALSARLLSGAGAWRVHGGGFAGCVQALMPEARFAEYKAQTEALFGKDACMAILI